MKATAAVRPARFGVPARALDGLTAEQRSAAGHHTGPLVIFAGPGAGKTRTLTHRIAHLIATGRASPHEILVVTFTVRAAEEMRSRLDELLGSGAAAGLLVCTFHSLGARMLREHPHRLGRDRSFTIYDQSEHRAIIAQCLPALAHGEPIEVDASARVIEAEISAAKNRLWTPGDYRARSRAAVRDLVLDAWPAAERELRACNAFCFDDLLAGPVELLRGEERLRRHYRRRFGWVLVDEYQDTNPAQLELIRLLCAPAGNVTVVGDDDQALYGFRFASPQTMLDFSDRFPDARRVVLSRNFRSRSEILGPAVRCVSHNKHREAKALLATRGPGGNAGAREFENEYAEAHWVTRQVARELERPDRQVLILGRAGWVTRTVQSTLAAAGIPHRVLGDLGLYERAEVKTALAYLALLVNPRDAQALRRAIQNPRRGIGDATARAIIEADRTTGLGDLIVSARSPAVRFPSPKAAGNAAEFSHGLLTVLHHMATGRSVAHTVVETLLMPGGLVAHHQQRQQAGGQARRSATEVLEDLRSLCRAAARYQDTVEQPTLGGFLEHANGLASVELGGETDVRVTVSTVHRAKGTEADLVILLACEESVLPSRHAIESADPGALEEERRVFYVAATRARDAFHATCTHTRDGRQTAGRSQFLVEAHLSPPRSAGPAGSIRSA